MWISDNLLRLEGIRPLIIFFIILGSCTTNRVRRDLGDAKTVTGNRLCSELQARGFDSLSNYELQLQKRRLTLEASLQLLNEAIQCDTTMAIAKLTRVRVYTLLGEFRKAISDIDELVRHSQVDSLFLISKARLYEQLSLEDSARNFYKELSQYYGRRLLKEPYNTLLIHHWLYSRLKSEGFDSVKSDIEIYRRKYSSDSDFVSMLDSIK